MDQKSELSVVILAAGKGTRMKSDKAKVLHHVFFRPMLHHVLDAVAPLNPARMIVIVGHQEEAVKNVLQSYDVTTVRQEQQLGTGHAVKVAKNVLPKDDGMVMILCGDTPLVSSSSLQKMHLKHLSTESDLTVMTTSLENPTGYGRIISAGDNVLAIVEEKEADEQQKKIQEINAGIYLVGRKFLFEALETLTSDNTQGEFYLTDIVEYAVSSGRKAAKFFNPAALEVLGVNSRVELESAHRLLKKSHNRELMQKGVSMHNHETVTVSPFTEIGRDTLLMENVHILGKGRVGMACLIEPGVVLQDCILGDNVKVGAGSVLKNCRFENGTEISPLTAKF